ncbi:hypothetical protein JTB14_010964 [Gonioctena quinquepunctata]|nr:hypothetical protein JTB14_010964 [Gonioctena quinquepunctata]
MEANSTTPPSIEEHYLTSHLALKEKYKEIMEVLNIKIRNNQSIPPNSFPQITIFRGSYEEWPTFSNLFTRIINQSVKVKQENSST